MIALHNQSRGFQSPLYQPIVSKYQETFVHIPTRYYNYGPAVVKRKIIVDMSKRASEHTQHKAMRHNTVATFVTKTVTSHQCP